MYRALVWTIGVAVIVGATLRFNSLSTGVPVTSRDLVPVRDEVLPLATIESLDELSQFRAGGVTNVALEQFDPLAMVTISVGPDGQPGIAGLDDDGSGVVDDRTELGATSSDDICEVRRGDPLDAGSDAPIAVLQRGAYAPATVSEVQQNPERPTRAIVYGRTNNDRWTFRGDINQLASEQ